MSFLRVSLYSLSIPFSVSHTLAHKTVHLPHGRTIEPSAYGTISTKESKVVYKFLEMLSSKSDTCRTLKFKDLSHFCEVATRTFCTQAQTTALKTLHNLLNIQLKLDTTSRKSSIIQGIYDVSGTPIQNLNQLKKKPFRILLSKAFMYYFKSGKKVAIDTRMLDSFKGYQSGATINLYNYLTWFEYWEHPRVNIKVNNLLSKIGRLDLIESPLQSRLQAITHHLAMINKSLKALDYDHQYEIRVYRPKKSLKTNHLGDDPVLRIQKVLKGRKIHKPLQPIESPIDKIKEDDFDGSQQCDDDCDVYEKPLSFIVRLKEAFINGTFEMSAFGRFQQRYLSSLWCKPESELSG